MRADTLRGMAPVASAPLANSRHEQFAQGVAGGMSAAEAYRAAGYAQSSGATANAARLTTNNSVAARIAWLKVERAAAAKAVATVDAQRIQQELEALAFSDIGTLFDEGPNATVRLKPITQWPEATRRAIASVKVKRLVEGSGVLAREVETTEFRLWPKDGALSQLREHMGLKKEDDASLREVLVRVVREGRKK